MNKDLYIQFASDRSILIKLGDDISEETHNRVYKVFHLILAANLKEVQSIHPAYNSILITFDTSQISPFTLKENILQLLQERKNIELPIPRKIEIPVCYESEFAFDISVVANHNSLTIDEVIQIHTKQEYLVYFLGFSPGFPYLGNMPKKISTPRLPKPRLKVPEGSVAIGGDQTGVYPTETPGGWNIIGRTPIKLFSLQNDEPTFLRMGDRIKFISITKKEFENIKNLSCQN